MEDVDITAHDDSVAIFDGVLDIDERELEASAEERGTLSDLTEDLRLLARQNHLRLLKVSAEREALGGDDAEALTTFKLVGLPHEQCRFVWASLTVDLTLTQKAIATSVEPEREDLATLTVTESVSPTIKASLSEASLESSLGGKKEVNYEVVRPQLLGINLEDRVVWRFSAPKAEQELNLKHDLRLKARFPKDAPGGLRANIVMRARVAFRGIAGIVPLIGKREAESGFIAYLDRL